MKKAFIFLIAILLAGAVSAQTSNTFKYVINAKGGIVLTLKADTASKVDSIKIVGGKIRFYHNGTQKDVDITSGNQISLSTIMPFNNDSIPRYTFGDGHGNATDSVLFAKNAFRFGYIPNYRDTAIIINFRNGYLSAGDSLKFNAYIGNYNTQTPRDSCWTSPQSVGPNQRYLTPNKATVVYPDEQVWLGLKADQITGKRPYEWWLDANLKQQNRTY